MKNLSTITLREIRPEDFPTILKWSRDETFCLVNGWTYNQEEQKLFERWERLINNASDRFLRWGIDMDGFLIGYIDLVLFTPQAAEIGIALGNSRIWGKGFGTRALKLAMDQAGIKYGIQTFYAETHLPNIRSRRMLEKLGFEEISRKGTDLFMGKETTLIQYKRSV